MKTTIELSENLLLRAKQRAKEESVTLKALFEKALTDSLQQPTTKPKVELVTFKGKGLSPEFEDATWEEIREAIYS